MAASDTMKIRLSIPRQDLAELSLFLPSLEATQAWADALPIANSHTIAQQLNLALSELNRMKLSPETRYRMLEALRPRLDMALGSLYKKYLNQPLVIPREPGKLAALAEQLLAAAGTAYIIVAVEAIQQRDKLREINPARLTCESIHRALVYAGRRVLQAFQLYRPLPMHGWQVLHQLYALAESQQLEELSLQDPLTGAHTIRATYLQSLILGCCKPNQLRQIDLQSVYHAMSSLGELATLHNPEKGAEQDTGLFAVDLGSDQPPLYASLQASSDTAERRIVNTDNLVSRLREIKNGARERQTTQATPLDAAEGLPGYLLDHLIDSLGSMSMRNFSRARTNNPLQVCVGLSSVHFHAAGDVDFEQLMHQAGSENKVSSNNPFATVPRPRSADMWSQANPEIDYVRNEWLPGQADNRDLDQQVELDEATRAQLLEEVEVKLPLNERYPIFKVALADASPGGYCLEWTEEPPADLSAGAIVSLKEDQGEFWSIAAIRWLSRLESSRTLIGLELLSPKAMAFGALVHLKDGSKGAPMRVLLLPEIKLVGQPDTLITPRASFRERQRVTLVSDGKSHTVKLTRQIASTANLSQFEFRFVQELGDVLLNENKNTLGSPFDSLWSNI